MIHQKSFSLFICNTDCFKAALY